MERVMRIVSAVAIPLFFPPRKDAWAATDINFGGVMAALGAEILRSRLRMMFLPPVAEKRAPLTCH